MLRAVAPLLLLTSALCAPPELRGAPRPEDARLAAEARLWKCRADVATRAEAIAALSARAERLGVEAAQHEKEAKRLTEDLERHGQDIAAAEGDVNAVTRVREMEHHEFLPLQKGYSELVEGLKQGLSPERAASALGLVRAADFVPAEWRQAAEALLAQAPPEPAQALDLVRRVDLWSGAKLGELQKAEATARRAYEALMVELHGRVAAASQARLALLVRRAQRRQGGFDARDDLSGTESSRDAARKALEGEVAGCQEQAAEDIGNMHTVTVDGRRGVVTWDGRPVHQFVKLKWVDNGNTSEVIPVGKIRNEVQQAAEDIGNVHTVTVDGRRGVVTWDGRPVHQFVKLKWVDNGNTSEAIPASKIRNEVQQALAISAAAPLGGVLV